MLSHFVAEDSIFLADWPSVPGSSVTHGDYGWCKWLTATALDSKEKLNNRSDKNTVEPDHTELTCNFSGIAGDFCSLEDTK